MGRRARHRLSPWRPATGSGRTRRYPPLPTRAPLLRFGASAPGVARREIGRAVPVLEGCLEADARAAPAREIGPSLELARPARLDLRPVRPREDGGARAGETARAEHTSVLDREHHRQDAHGD